jgi:hypothetical protein
MQEKPINEIIQQYIDLRKNQFNARLFLSREDGITIYDSVQNHTTNSIAALVSGVWQASDALIGLVNKSNLDLDFRLAFDTTSQGVYLLPLTFQDKQYFLGAIYEDCMNPAQLKRQISLLKDELQGMLTRNKSSKPKTEEHRKEYLFQDITDTEMDKLFSLGGI